MTLSTHVAMLKGGGKMSNGEVDDEIVLPGVVRGSGGAAESSGAEATSKTPVPSTGASNPAEPEAESDDEENLDDVEETVSERLIGLMEMMPDRFWSVLGRSLRLGYWFVRRSGWVLGTSAALLVLPPLLEQQRVEIEEMQTMQKKQMLLGPGHSTGMTPPLSPR